MNDWRVGWNNNKFRNSTSICLHYLKTFLLLRTLVLPIVQPLSFNIANFNDTESASFVGYTGVTKIENGTLVLNSLVNDGVGRAIYAQPLHLKNSSNGNVTHFSTRFSFTIDVSTKSYGDGFAFYVAPLAYPIPPDAGGGLLGLYGDTQNIIAVEFDTYLNEYGPHMYHVGINNNSKVSLATSWFDIERNIGNMVHVLITYNASAKLLSVPLFPAVLNYIEI
ncbi:lectin beta-1 and beta-2 chains [Cajanus cajan]|uniref:lectin beta-1 and beta-2 chains n=1 Tax=Cajanus cajan TaxID=3821 RepID=UPI00098DA509|nr:lectin beta-1 and beta-2 chains [Cajanus cajan]